MSGRVDDVMQLCCEVSASRKMTAAVKSSGKGAAAAGGGAFVGGMVGGPAGIAVGGTLGGLMGTWMTSGQFKPLPEIIMELPPKYRETLYSDVTAALGTLDWTDVTSLIALVMGSATLQERVLAAILYYATKELKAEVLYEK
ncbi:protein C19orf12 homolog [Rhinichthys klamathensis goyatoka]|uniref:protein C19orf12 homolog n=1 Tax=Rhinichthys klamathensis goyatoka TaxID=3034132 RepID=UPI0024B5DBEC|nr:protein C19orf12 homolog [Rhinichthys klamathensis goyatoka]XP_056104361.1 protein C19orf12 homolog [Rhinichthys klamathensis goyatoka]